MVRRMPDGGQAGASPALRDACKPGAPRTLLLVRRQSHGIRQGMMGRSVTSGLVDAGDSGERCTTGKALEMEPAFFVLFETVSL